MIDFDHEKHKIKGKKQNLKTQFLIQSTRILSKFVLYDM